MVVTLPLFLLSPSGSSTHSRVSAGMFSLSLRDFMPRARLCDSDRVLTPPFVAP